MAVCTFVSRAADSVTVPRVKTDTKKSKKLTYSAEGNGTAEEQYGQMVPEGLLVKWCASAGSKLKEGSAVVVFLMDDLKKVKTAKEEELEKFELQAKQDKIYKVDVRAKRREIKEIDRLIEAEGALKSEAEGVLIDPGVVAGQRTTGSELIRIGTGGGESEDVYDCVLPLAAVRMDSKGYYCLAVEERDGVLGATDVAVRINLKLEAQGDNEAAVSGSIGEDTEIITESSRNVEEGDRVRVER